MCRHGTEYSTLPTRAWMSGPIFAFAQVASTNGSAGSGLSASFSAAANTAAGRGAVQRTARPGPGDLGAPAFRLGLHLRQAGELPPAPERVPHVRHRPLDPRLVGGPEHPRRVREEPVVRGQLGIGPVDLRVIQVRPVHPGLEVVRDQPGRHPAEERERRHVAFAPPLLVQPDHRPHEQVPRARQHHHERPHRDRLPRRRVQPAAQPPVIDLRLGARLGRPGPQHLDLRPARLLRHVRRHIPAETRDAHRHALLIPQPLMDRRDRDPGLAAARG